MDFMSTWDSHLYQNQHSFVWKFGADLLPLLDPQAAEDILDVGCGTGELTAQIAATGARVTGLDASAGMIEKARVRLPEANWIEADIRYFQPPQQYDAVFSNAALHWVTDPSPAVANIASALKPGGRFVAEFGGAGNCRLLLEHGGLPNPWYFPTIPEYTTLLAAHGLETRQAFLFDRFTRLDDPIDGLRNWLRMFGHQWTLDDPMLEGIEARCRPHLFRDGFWHVDYRRIRVVAVKLAS